MSQNVAAGVIAAGYIIAGLTVAAWPQSSSLCVSGHPAKRSEGLTYGGLLPRHGFERDHIIPMCLGGPDDILNMQLQPWSEATKKDAHERLACEAYCRGDVPLSQARSWFHREYDWQGRKLTDF